MFSNNVANNHGGDTFMYSIKSGCVLLKIILLQYLVIIQLAKCDLAVYSIENVHISFEENSTTEFNNNISPHNGGTTYTV